MTKVPQRGPRDHPDIVVATSHIGGCGVFATSDLAVGIKLSPFDGPIYLAQSDDDLPPDERGYPIQISETEVQGAHGYANFFAHCCHDPLAGVRYDSADQCYWVVTRRAVQSGQEICFDYAMTQWLDDFIFCPPQPCRCGHPSCRGTRLGCESLPDDVYQMYLQEGFIAPWLQRKRAALVGHP